MELLNLLLYTGVFLQLTWSRFFDFLFIMGCLKIAYYSNPSYDFKQYEFSNFVFTFTHLALHTGFYYLNILIGKINATNYGNKLISNYNYVNNIYVFHRSRMIYNFIITPVKYFLKQLLLGQLPTEQMEQLKQMQFQTQLNSQSVYESENNLKTTEQINLFLDKILLENKQD